MGKRISTSITRNYLESVALPNHGGRYTPISHKSIIDKVHEELTKRGFNVETELYRASLNGNVANGMYILDQGSDPDMKMMFVWGNSYDKSMRFKCGIGVYIPKTGNYIFAGSLASYSRKHTGKADEEAIEIIQSQLNMANAHYTELVHAKDMLVGCSATLRTYSELTGRMFIEKQCLTKEQACAVRDRLVGEVALLDNVSWTNAWNYYNSVATALRSSHPYNWFEVQASCHSLITKYFALATLTDEPVQDSVQVPVQDIVQEPDNQLSIFDVIDNQEPVATTMSDLPEDVQEQIYAEDILEQKTFSGEVNPDEEFFNFGNTELPTFDLPDL